MKKRVENLSSVICSAFCILLLLPAVASGGDLPDFVSPKFMQVTVIANNMTYNGMKMKSAEFSSTKGLEDIKAFYAEFWEGRIKDVGLGSSRVLSHHDGKYLFVVQVDKKDDNARLTRGLLSISEPGSLPSRFVPGKGFPLPAGSRVVNDILAEDFGKESRTLTFINKQNIDFNLRYYRNRFGREGWVEMKQGKRSAGSGAGKTLIMNRGGNELNIAFMRRKGSTVVVAVMVYK